MTALACEARASGEAGTPANAGEDNETTSRSPARYPKFFYWRHAAGPTLRGVSAALPVLRAPMRIIAFITDTTAIRQILDPIGEPSTPPPLATARGPPGWDSEETTQEDPTWGLPAVDPGPDYDHDQSVRPGGGGRYFDTGGWIS